MKRLFIGTVKFSESTLKKLIDIGENIVAIFTKEKSSFNVDFALPVRESWFVPNVFIDITDYMEKKLGILKIYNSEIGEHPFPRSLENIRALSKFRGAMSNFKYAESFMLVRERVK